MSTLKRLPWVSLTLLLLTYGILGWLISTAHVQSFVWLPVVIAVLFLIENLTSSWWIADCSSIFSTFNIRSFSFVFLGAFLFFLMIAWFKVFVDTIILIIAVMRAQLDFQDLGFRERQSFWILSVLSLTGLALGVLIQKLI